MKWRRLRYLRRASNLTDTECNQMKSLFKNVRSIADTDIHSTAQRIRVGIVGTTGILSLFAGINLAIPPKVAAQTTPAYCSILYGIDNTGTTFSKIYNVDVTNAHYNAATANSGATATNTAFLSAAAALEPSTGRLFYISRDTSGTKIAYWNPVTNTQTQLAQTFNAGSTVVRAAFSPSGRLFVATSNTIFEINPTTGALISSKALSGVAGALGNGDMAFDGNNILFLASDEYLYTIDIDTLSSASPASLLATAPSGTTFNSLGFKPDGKLYSFAGSNKTMYEVNTNTGDLTAIGVIVFNPTTGASVVGTDYASCAAPIPDLQSTKTYTKVSGSAGSDILPGDVVEYTVTITNTGSVPATKVNFKDPIPAGTTYVTGSTKMNGVAVADATGPTFPFATGAAIQSPGLNSGVVGTGNTYQVTIKYRIKVNTVSPPATVSNQGSLFYLGGPGGGTPTDDPGTPTPDDPTITVISIPINISGKVWKDADGSANNSFTNINTGTETGTNGGGLNAILINASGNVIATTPVAADGTYTFSSVAVNQNNVTIRLSTTAGTVGSAAPAASLPAGWTNTSPLTTATFNIATTNITSKDFGIEQLPNTDNKTASSQTNPGGTTTVQVPSLSGSDPEDSTLGTGNTFIIKTLPTNGKLYYNGTQITTTNFAIPSYDPTKLTVDPDDGAITVSFTYAALDAAGKEDPTPATVSIPFTAPLFSISGTLYQDSDGGDDLDIGEPTLPANVTVKLLDSTGTTTIATTTTNATGQYTFTNVTNGNYKIQVDTTDTDIPTGFTLGTANNLAVTVSGSPITAQNFGFDIATGFCNVGGGTNDPTIQSYISTEVGNTSVAGAIPSNLRSLTDQLDDTWRTAAGGSATGTVEPWFGVNSAPGSATSFTYKEPNNNTAIATTVESVQVPFTTAATCNGGNAAGSGFALAFGNSLQDSSPRPASLYNTADEPGFWNHTGGSSDSKRNAVRFTFAQPVKSFGAWFGDLETRTQSGGAPAYLRLLDASGNRIGQDIAIAPQTLDNGTTATPNPQPLNQSNCSTGATSQLGCGNQTSRWVGFVDTNASARIKQVLVIVGDDDDTGNGDTERLSFIGSNLIPVSSNPNILLVKRITAINGVPFNQFVDDPNTTNDNDPKWPTPANTYLRGVIDGGVVKPGDELEYTIYFLSRGDGAATNVSVCDLVPSNTTFLPTVFNGLTPTDGSLPGANLGVALALDSANLPSNPNFYLSNVADTDRGQFFAPGTTPPVSCSGTNNNGAVVVNLVKKPDSLPRATAAGTPTNSYGFIRFRAVVK